MSSSKGRHQFKRRFSLQPSFMKDYPEEEAPPPRASEESSIQAYHKIVVLGAAKVGKTSLITQFLYNTYSPKYKRTVEEMHRGDFTIGGVSLTLDILDTSGAYEFPAMRALSISSADGFILVYDITNASSFDEARAIRDQILETKTGHSVPIVMVGNKLDLAEHREVDVETTESVVTVDWENGFVETSAKDNINVNQVFKALLLQAKVKYSLTSAFRRRQRPCAPRHSISEGAAAAAGPAAPTQAQLHHLEQLHERHTKRNSCTIS